MKNIVATRDRKASFVSRWSRRALRSALAALVATSIGLGFASGSAWAAPTTITSVSFSGTPAAPTITVSGSGFGTKAGLGTPNPASSTQNCSPATGDDDYGTNLYLRDPHFVAGLGPPALAAVGVRISSYSPTRIVFTLGSCYGHNGWTIAPGDGYTMNVLGASFSGTAFSADHLCQLQRNACGSDDHGLGLRFRL